MVVMPTSPALGSLHPAVAEWFASTFLEGPTEAQALAWPLVRSGTDVLVAAPTGSGKTLAGFLMAIDRAYRAYERGEELRGRTRVVYVSPLKALAVDVQQNLERPLAAIARSALALGRAPAPVTVAVRTGDTPPPARSAMVKDPPTVLVTTPESLYLYVTAERSRETLRHVETVIVDEIHALARDKRGSHLALTLERLEHLQDGGHHPQRVGLSATQRPIELTARLLSGTGRHVEVVDCGHRRDLRVSIELPEQELAAVLSQEQLADLVQKIAAHVKDHRTTLVFVNTRRLSERLAHLLGEFLGPDHVAAHHGSLSAERRRRTESRLRAGDLRALVATASLELGIDVGPVELVCQVGSPRAISTFLQRVGRSNHSRHGVPEGILYPTTRDELVECAALLAGVKKGLLDALEPPVAPLDILAQQLIAEVAAEGEWQEGELFDLCRRAAPYASLTRADFDAVVELASEGIATGRGTRMAYLHRDRVNGVLRPRRGARLAALTSGGAIPEVGDYRVIAEPDELFVGSVNEDFAVETMAGDVFLLGTHPWRARRVGAGEIRVVDAEGARPTVPFWLGEAPSRTAELSSEVCVLRRSVAEALQEGGFKAAVDWAQRCSGLDAVAAEQLVAYLSSGLAQLGVMPTDKDIVFERFFDEAGGMQLVVHAPFGGRVNRGLGLALRKRFCVTFDFELQAAANDDAVILSLGPQHSFALSSVPKMLRPATLEATLEQAVLASPMFSSRWRWDLSRALAILRFRGGRKNPLPVQRMEADDLMAAIFPALAACQENTPPGPVELPDHVIVRQVLYDCLHEAMDIEGLRALVSALHSGEVRPHFVESVEPSVFSHEIVNSEPYTYLDDAPLEERRARQVKLRRGLPVEARDLNHLDPAAIKKVRDEAAASPRNPDELHDILLATVVHRPRADWQKWFDELVASGRAMTATQMSPSRLAKTGRHGTGASGAPRAQARPLWCATERREWAEALLPDAIFEPDLRLSSAPATAPSPSGNEPGGPAPAAGALTGAPPLSAPDPDEAAALSLRGHLGLCGPTTVETLASELFLPESRIRVGLARLEAEGFAMQGRFDPDLGEVEQWCARHLLQRIHGYTQSRQRRGTNPVSAEEFMRFLLRWQHVAPGTRRQGRAGLLAVIEQLQGWEAAAGAWEEAILPARVENYQSRWLEDLCLAGEVTWGRLSLRAGDGANRRGASTPSRATPVAFALREDLDWLLAAKRGAGTPEEPPYGPAREVLEVLQARGAMFASELAEATRRLPSEVHEGLWDLVSRGLVTSDGFGAVRALFATRDAWALGHPRGRRYGALRWRLGTASRRTLGPAAPTASLAGRLTAGAGGRWALLAPGAQNRLEGAGCDGQLRPGERGAQGPAEPSRASAVLDGWARDELAEAVAGQLLARWGVVFWDLASNEELAVPWRDILWALRRLEARGLVRGGRFVNGFAGEQYALPEALDELRRAARAPKDGQVLHLSGADPLNLSGVLLAVPRVRAVRANKVTFRDGSLLCGQPPAS